MEAGHSFSRKEKVGYLQEGHSVRERTGKADWAVNCQPPRIKNPSAKSKKEYEPASRQREHARHLHVAKRKDPALAVGWT